MVDQWGAQAVLGNEPLDIAMLVRMSALKNVYTLIQKVRGMEGKAIHTLTDGEREIIAMLREEGWL